MQFPNPSKIWNRFCDLIITWTSPTDIGRESGLRYWQERVVLTILFTGLILGFFAYIPSVRLCIKEKLWGVALFDTAIYAVFIILFFFRKIPFSVRAHAIIYSSFLLGLILLAVVGPSASGPVWLFTFPVLAGVIIGARTSVYALIVNIFAMLMIGYLIHIDYPAWMAPQPHTTERWIVISLNFILLNAIAAMSLAIVLKGLQSSLKHEKSMRLSLEHEIDERKEAEKTLKESEERYRKIIHGAAEGVVIYDAKSLKTILVNEAAEAMLGYDNKDMTGIHIQTIFNNPDLNSSLLKWLNAGSQEKFLINDYQVRCPDDSEKFFNLSNTKIFVDKRKCIVCFMTDITAQKIKEIEKQKLQHHLQKAQKMESIGTLAGGIAHDFNNILSSIIGFSELALDDVEKQSEIEEHLQEIHTAGNRAKDLVKQILTFARKTDDEFKPVQVNLIAKEALKLIRASIPTSIEIRQHIDCDSLILADATQVHQIFMNLCTNAAQAMEEDGGLLEVSLSEESIKGIYITSHGHLKPGRYLKIKISDSGTGISEEHIETIFEPYFTTKPIGEGTGLGLSVVQGIVKKCGGEISVESDIGKETAFSVYLPTTKKRADIKSYTTQKLPKGSERLIVIDDEIPIAKMLSQSLKKQGYSVSTFNSSKDALEMIKKKPDDFDLVITDMNMPQMTGDKLAIELLKLRPEIPIILCTGYSKRISEERAVDIGIAKLLKKPVANKTMVETVRKVLDEAKSDNQG